MKKLLPLIATLFLLSSCEEFFELFNETENDRPAMESFCKILENEDLTEKELMSLAYSINSDIVDMSEIESIEYTFTFSNGGDIDYNAILNSSEAFQTSIDTIFTSRNSISRNIIIKPNRTQQSEYGDIPFDVAEIILDMPGTGTVITEDLDCCNSVSVAITNVVVTLKDGIKSSIKLPGCYKIIDTGKCCDVELK